MSKRWLILAVVSCTADIERVHLAPPVEYQSAIVAADEDDGRGFRMFAARPGDPIQIPSSDQIVLHLIAYDRTLEELDLAPGPIVESSPCRKHCIRLAPKAVFTAQGAPGALEWVPAELPTDVADRLVESRESTCGPCRTYEQRNIELPGEGWPMFIDRYRDGVAIGLLTGEVIEMQPGGSPSNLCRFPPQVRTGAFAQSTMVVALEDGRVLAATDLSGEQCRFVLLGTVQGFPVRLAGSESGPLEAYVITNDAGQAMFWKVAEGAAPERLHMHAVNIALVREHERQHRGDVLWLEPGHAVFAAGDDAFYRVRDDVVSTETLDVPERAYRVQSLLATSSGLIAGVEPWGIATASGSSWQTTYGEPTWGTMNALVEHDGVVIVGQEGNLEYFDPATGDYCPRWSHVVQSRIPKYLAPLSSTELVVADQSPDPPGPSIVRLLELRDQCN